MASTTVEPMKKISHSVCRVELEYDLSKTWMEKSLSPCSEHEDETMVLINRNECPCEVVLSL